MNTVKIDTYDTVRLVEFEHPDGSTGVMATITASTGTFAEYFDLTPKSDDVVTVPLRHNTDGRTDFESYTVADREPELLDDTRGTNRAAHGYQLHDGETLVTLEMTDSQLAELQQIFAGHKVFRGP